MGITVSYRAMTQADFKKVLDGEVLSLDVEIIEIPLAKSYHALHYILTGKEVNFVDKNNPLSIAILGWNDDADEDGNWYWEGCGWWEIWIGDGYNDSWAVKKIAQAMKDVDFDECFERSGYELKYKSTYKKYFEQLKAFYQMCADNDYAVEVDFW